MKKVAVIMAGGKGERFWPKSRVNMPKQFLNIVDDEKSMLQLTVERIKQIVDIEDIFVATSTQYEQLVRSQLPQIKQENILLEPVAKNTAPCIGYAAAVIKKRYEEAVMLVLPADQLIKFESIFINTLNNAIDVAEEEESLITIGITPTYPETGYGYIKFNDTSQGKNNIYKVERFVEKPSKEIAKEYLMSGDYLWNSGMFVWKVSTILTAFQRYLPNIYDGLLKIEETVDYENETVTVQEEFNKFTSESIDYGIMEKADNIYTLPASFGWDDVGSWLALERVRTSNQYGNIVSGNAICIDTKNTIIEGSSKLIATIGLENTIIVDTPDAMLICAKDSTQDVKKVLDNLRICNRDEYL